MQQSGEFVSAVLADLSAFLALTAFAGGIGLLTGRNARPGVAQSVLVGGTAVIGTVCLVRPQRLALPVAAAAGIAIMIFEFVEILVIGSQSGIARDLQGFYLAIGTLIVALAPALEILASRQEQR